MVKKVKLFVEGGGDSNALHTECRQAFNSFLKKSGLQGCMPRIVACGTRNNAYSDYCTAIQNKEEAFLLVDSESPIVIPPDANNGDDIRLWKPWHHLKNRQNQSGQRVDNWDCPDGGSDDDCHLMVEIMESWFLADVEALRKYYGQDFKENCLPKPSSIELVSKAQVLSSLKKATKDTQKGAYDKGNHSFKILESIDPQKVIDKSPWAKHFIDLLHEKMTKSC